MHLKNFSLINNGESWGLSPAYDLLNVSTMNTGDNEELALSLKAEKRRIKKEDFDQLGASLGLNQIQIQGVYKRFSRNKNLALNWNQNSFLSPEYQKKYMEL